MSGASGELGDGWWRACRMSRMPAKMRSLDDANGMVSFVGNPERVSQMRVARISQSQTV